MGVTDGEPDGREGLGAPEHERSGQHVDEAVEKFEEGSRIEGAHTPSGQAKSGESRMERMVDVDRTSTGRSAAEQESSIDESPPAGPAPTDIGSGGAQRIEGARISDRVAGGQPVPEGPPFDSEAPPRRPGED